VEGAAELARRGAVARNGLVGPIVAVVVVGLLALLPLLVDRRDLLNLLFLVFLNVCLGQSWNVLAGFAGQINLGHAAFFGIGALVTRALWVGGMPLPVALLAAALAAVAFAWVIGIPTFRLRGAYFAIGTLGVAEVLRITVGNVLPTVAALPSELIAGYDVAARYYLALGVAAACVLAAQLLLRSRLSLGILAVREDEDAALATGVNALLHKLLALTISSFFAGLAGGTFAFYHVSYYPELVFSPLWTFDAVLITFVGGLGTLIGPVVGALFFVVVREQLAVALVQLHQVIFGVLFILVVLVLPGGLVGAWERIRGRQPPRAPPGS
jgi:branched-chain amino acid transport system permease protein